MCPFSFGHCIICPSIYASDYPFVTPLLPSDVFNKVPVEVCFPGNAQYNNITYDKKSATYYQHFVNGIHLFWNYNNIEIEFNKLLGYKYHTEYRIWYIVYHISRYINIKSLGD